MIINGSDSSVPKQIYLVQKPIDGRLYPSWTLTSGTQQYCPSKNKQQKQQLLMLRWSRAVWYRSTML